MTIGIIAPTRDETISLKATCVKISGGDRNKLYGVIWNIELPVIVVAGAGDMACLGEQAAVGLAPFLHDGIDTITILIDAIIHEIGGAWMDRWIEIGTITVSFGPMIPIEVLAWKNAGARGKEEGS